MRGYADLTDCRREYLLNYFGEVHTPPCDNCLSGLSAARPPSAQLFPINSQVVHKTWGPGLVMRYAGDTMVVLFDFVGYRTRAIDLVTSPPGLSSTAGWVRSDLGGSDAVDGSVNLKGSGAHGRDPVTLAVVAGIDD